jgi:hypothetical protein
MSSRFTALLDSSAFWACWGLAFAVMCTRLPEWTWPPDGAHIAGLVICTPVAMLLAAPQRNRPIVLSNRWHHRAVMHRNTLLSAGFVLIVAITQTPTMFDVSVDAALLTGYLLLVDAATMPADACRRTAHPLFVVALVGLVAASTAIVALPGSSSPYPRIVAAVAGTAVVTAAVAAAFTGAKSRRVGSRGPESPESDPPEVHR